MKPDGEAFRKSYSAELGKTAIYSADALEQVMRNSLSSLAEAGIRELMPTIMHVAATMGIGLFVAAEVIASDTAKDLNRYGSVELAEAAKRFHAALDAVPKDAAMMLETVRLMGETIKAYGPHRSRLRRLLDRILGKARRNSL